MKIFLSLTTTPRKAKWTEIFRISPLFPTTPRKPEKADGEDGVTTPEFANNFHASGEEYADIKLFAKSSMASFVDSLTAPLSLINALLVSLGMHRKEHSQSALESLETLWSQYRVYETGRDRTTEDGDIL